jgi:ketosteroid isomerase-like protein
MSDSGTMSDSGQDEGGALRPAPAWASGVGQVAVGSLGLDPERSRAIDRAEIAERIARYGWAYDERDRARLEDCFTEDGVWEGSVMGLDPIPPIVGREAVARWLCEFWDVQADQRRHIFTNVIVDLLDGDRAVAYAYLLLTAASGAAMTPVTAGPYRFELRREPDSWRLARLTAGFDAPF